MNRKSSIQIEQEAEQSRERVASLLEELRGRVSPGELVDQVYDYTREGAPMEFMRTLNAQVKSNPLAVTLIGAGISWLMLSERRTRAAGDTGARRASAAAGEAYEQASEGMAEAGSTIGETASQYSEQGADVASRAAGSVSEMGARTSRTVAHTASRAADAASRAAGSITGGAAAARQSAAELAERSRRGARRIAETGGNLLEQIQNQPLALAGIGFAIGALIGSTIPPTRTEDELMGERSDELKESAKQFGQVQYEKGREAAAEAAERGVDETKQVAEEVGIVPSEGETTTEADRQKETAAGASVNDRG